jgi:NAD+-dependent protein deacetylase sirtuin 6
LLSVSSSLLESVGSIFFFLGPSCVERDLLAPSFDPGPVLGYAKRLSPYSHKGRCGDEVAEEEEGPAGVQAKIQVLADLISRAAYCVAHTGAGISTAAGIPDFRGRNGIWTREKQGHPLPHHEPFWTNAVPTLGHMALVGLMRARLVHYVVSQNIDGLHLRSGVPRSQLSELHGNMMLERCDACGLEVHRTIDVGGVGLKPTGRACPRPRCGSRLRDALLDWEDGLPEPDFGRALAEAAKCRRPWGEKERGGGGLALCLGTSMQMSPARELPLDPPAGRVALVNLQPTEMDDECHLVVRARIDDVLYGVVKALGLRVPEYERRETFYLHHQVTAGRHRAGTGGREDEEEGCCEFQATYRLSVGESTLFNDAPSGYLARVTLRLPPALGGEEVVLAAQPFTHSARAVVRRPRAACPVCCSGGDTAAAEPDGVWEEVGVTVEFEPTPAVRAGAAVLPSSTPRPWTGTYALPFHKSKDAGSRAVEVCLTRVDYEEIYRPSWSQASTGGADDAAATPVAHGSNERQRSSD